MDKAEKGICFVICPIGDDGSEVRTRADEVLDHVIKPAALECGYEAVRSDKYASPGDITVQIVEHLLDDPMVVADLTGKNANVFFELAIRMTTLKPFVLMHEQGESIPFDVTGLRAIPLDSHKLSSAAQCRKELVEQMTSAEQSPEKIATPVSMVRDRQAVQASQESLPVATRAVNLILDTLAFIRSDLARLSARTTEPPGLTAEQVQAIQWLTRSAPPTQELPVSDDPIYKAALRAAIANLAKRGKRESDDKSGGRGQPPDDE